MYLIKTPHLLKKAYPSFLTWNMCRSEKEIFLTFDDGPVPEITPWVLKTLKQYQAEATFFCIGDNVRKHPEIYQQLLAENHAVGNHTFLHLKGWATSDDRYLEDIRKCAQLVPSELFRPPYGRIKRSQIYKLQQAGLDNPTAGTVMLPRQIIMWDVLSGDFDTDLTPEKCLRNAIRYTENGSIVVFHDSVKAEKRLRYALPRALEYWQEKGFQFRKLSF